MTTNPVLPAPADLTPAGTAAGTAATTSTLEPLPAERLARAKKAYTTRFLAAALAADGSGHQLLHGPEVAPRSGDVVLARVEEIGKHTRLEGPGSRRQTLFVGDEVLVAYGNRYAPDQFEAVVPDDLGPTDLVAAGGVAGRVVAQHAALDDATRLRPLGLLARDGERVTLADHAPVAARPVRERGVGPRVVAVLGTSMNSGKSTALACLVRGLSADGLHVNAGKVTGTGAGGDPRLFADAGARRVLDFTDVGHPSTYLLSHARVRTLLSTLVEELAADSPDVVVVEIADGVYQEETARLLADPLFATLVDDVVFAAGDALGAVAGRQALAATSARVRAVSGVLTASPLAHREAARALDLPVVATYDLCDPAVARELLA
ncbi:hypothetical protein [Nocardioides sp. Leaf285]|uniref:hypothetical protein n=1 Tax=Nocardioides sp. Leaf285 TaxID=1736322 RepID=UPI0007035B48|nr:hypothetical protein [Nocardioides sp. Leaf285]KQP65602.1 malic enzyme protein [Nocardioides sp. Leaf285]